MLHAEAVAAFEDGRAVEVLEAALEFGGVGAHGRGQLRDGGHLAGVGQQQRAGLRDAPQVARRELVGRVVVCSVVLPQVQRGAEDLVHLGPRIHQPAVARVRVREQLLDVLQYARAQRHLQAGDTAGHVVLRVQGLQQRAVVRDAGAHEVLEPGALHVQSHRPPRTLAAGHGVLCTLMLLHDAQAGLANGDARRSLRLRRQLQLGGSREHEVQLDETFRTHRLPALVPVVAVGGVDEDAVAQAQHLPAAFRGIVRHRDAPSVEQVLRAARRILGGHVPARVAQRLEGLARRGAAACEAGAEESWCGWWRLHCVDPGFPVVGAWHG